ncbi:MAG: rod shape-determining protein MreC [Chitinophagales bacterium]|jgi:rod shape-determining protein MreC|nr:rod shape-determining protein MreC [Sphingobacteriales bacterium]MBP6664219.1 rod shape-determining protein MreC [Chitinophagales bacterium]MBP7533309.1 rod shape-determining protein MreC [Chitinophagales bacterium]
MQAIIDFFTQKYAFLLFMALEILCINLIVQNNSYQRASALNSTNAISGNLLEKTNGVKHYFHLKETNDSLVQENARLMAQLAMVHNQLFGLEEPDFCEDSELALKKTVLLDTLFSRRQQKPMYYFIGAQVINKSTLKLNNTITINKGIKDGVHPEMGVISKQGVVGVVKDVSENFSLIIPIIHKSLRVGTKLQSNGLIGSLRWDLKNPAYAVVDDIPKHEHISVGDTVLTSGYSSFFPPNVMIGVVEGWVLAEGSNFYQIKIKLATDFSRLDYVYVIDDKRRPEQKVLEYKAKNE